MSVDPGALELVLGSAEQVYLSVLTKSGPHVTPELFTTSGGHVLCVTAESTLKVRLLREQPVIGIAAVSGGAALSGYGTVQLLDPASPTSALAAPAAAAKAPLGLARYLLDNAAELTGAAMSALAGRLGGPIPPRRVVLVISLSAATLVDGDRVVVEQGWDISAGPAVRGSVDDDAQGPDLGALRDDLRELAATGPAVVGWTASDGRPLALPATYDAGSGVATLPTALFRACGAATTSPACITFDTWSGYGPIGKQGLMLRGEGRAVDDGGRTRITVDISRATHWDGIETGTTELTR